MSSAGSPTLHPCSPGSTHIAEQQRFAAKASHELRTPWRSRDTARRGRKDEPRSRELVDRLQAATPERLTSPKRCSCSAARQRSFTPGTSTCPSSRRSHGNAPPFAQKAWLHHRNLRRHDPHHRLTRAPAAVDHEPRAERHRHNLPDRAPCGSRPAFTPRTLCSLSKTPARSSLHSSCHACGLSSRHRTHTHDHAGVGLGLAMSKASPKPTTEPHPHPPIRWRAPRTVQLPPAPRHWQMTISELSPRRNSQGLWISVSCA